MISSSYSDFELFNKQTNGKITDIEFIFAICIVVITIFYNGRYIYRLQQQLCFEFIHLILIINQYAKKGEIILSHNIEQLLEIDDNDNNSNNSNNINNNINNNNKILHEDEYENGTIKINGGRSEDYGSPPQKQKHHHHNRKISIYSDEEEISKLSSLRLKIEKAIQNEQEELEEQEEDSDLESSSSMSPQPMDPKSPISLKLDESLTHSSSTINPVASNHNPPTELAGGFTPNCNGSGSEEINDLMQIQDIRYK